ncbi:MAG: ArnT family glycosyltransferase [Stellaceae bacterium]
MPDTIGAEQAPARPLAATNASLAGRLALCGIVLIAAALRGWWIDAGSFIVPYYLAGVRSQLESWHNFLFNAFDPAGFISLDKPPVAFWLQAASAELFGFGTVSVLLPQLAEGIGSVALLYALVRRYFGVAAGLLAALFLALTPLAVAVDRSNNTESCLILVLLLAAWALFRAIDSGRISPLLVSAAFVGIAFNVKMLVAFGVVPIFALVYLVATRPLSWWRLGWLSLAGVVLAALSLSWSLAYDLTPPAERPFAGSSDGNSMLELAVGHNGVERFVRRARTGGQVGALVAEPGSEPGAPTSGRDFAPAGPLSAGRATRWRHRSDGSFPSHWPAGWRLGFAQQDARPSALP